MKKYIQIMIIALITILGIVITSYSYKISAACEHKYPSNWTITVQATCTEDGKKVKICTLCGKERSRTIEKKGHDYPTEWTTTLPATCITTGTKTRTCSRCGKVDSKSIAIDADNHTGNQEELVVATCTKKGKKKCGSCGVTYQTSKDKNNHEQTATEKMKDKATCSSYAKWSQYYPCCETYTGDVYEKETGKTPDDLIEVITKTENGVKTVTGYKAKTYTVNGKEYTYGYDITNHEGEQEQGEVKYGYETKEKNNGKIVLVKYKYTTYICSSCDIEYTVKKKIRTLTESETEEEGQSGNNSAFNIESIPTSISKNAGTWDETAHYDWVHTDGNTGKLEFLPTMYNNRTT